MKYPNGITIITSLKRDKNGIFDGCGTSGLLKCMESNRRNSAN